MLSSWMLADSALVQLVLVCAILLGCFQICMNVWIRYNINATLIYMHCIQIGTWSLPSNTPYAISKCIYVCTYSLHICRLLGYPYNAFLCTHITHFYIVIFMVPPSVTTGTSTVHPPATRYSSTPSTGKMSTAPSATTRGTATGVWGKENDYCKSS